MTKIIIPVAYVMEGHRITIPKRIRKKYNINVGDELLNVVFEIEDKNEGSV